MHINCCWLFLICSRVGGLSCTDGTVGPGKAARPAACSPGPRFTTGTCSRATLSIVSSNTCTRRHGDKWQHAARGTRAVSRTDFTAACCNGMSRQWARSVMLMMPASRAHSQPLALPYTASGFSRLEA